jgi:hypothetical protein
VAAGKVVKTLELAGYAAPVVALVVGPFVHKEARAVSSSGGRAARPREVLTLS